MTGYPFERLRIGGTPNQRVIRGPNGAIASLYAGGPPGEQEAYARLFKASPKMLEALKVARDECLGVPQIVDDAIAEAEGS